MTRPRNTRDVHTLLTEHRYRPVMKRPTNSAPKPKPHPVSVFLGVVASLAFVVSLLLFTYTAALTFVNYINTQ